MRLGKQLQRALLALGLASTLGWSVSTVSAADEHEDDHGAQKVDAHEVADAEHGGHDAHGVGEVNWYYGIFGESEDAEEPSLFFRTPGMPVPLLAQLFNTLLLFVILYRFGKAPIMSALRARRESIMKGIDAASKMKAEAQASLDQYEAKLAKVDQEIERVRREMREAAVAERENILEEAKRRRERMERDAKLLVEQELKAAREILLQETIRTAVQSAEGIVTNKASSADHQRLSEEYLGSLQASIEASGLAGSAGGAGGGR